MFSSSPRDAVFTLSFVSSGAGAALGGDDSLAELTGRLGRVHKIEPENILLALNANVETITVIRPFLLSNGRPAELPGEYAPGMAPLAQRRRQASIRSRRKS